MPPFDTGIRDSILKEKMEQLEQERIRLLDIVVKTLEDIREKYGIKEAYIVGSLLQSHRWYDLSDIDIAVRGCSQHSFSIMADLEEATDKDVDVIELDNYPNVNWLRKKGMKVYG
ncbi:nucleotidyltransferase domain-containing protein [Candidatus Poribacteria bacterium]|nr:nucleotidyltransferase domain-containing protein [Candidatus Poribacteria bacterium]